MEEILAIISLDRIPESMYKMLPLVMKGFYYKTMVTGDYCCLNRFGYTERAEIYLSYLNLLKS